jgi:hypothetical protein
MWARSGRSIRKWCGGGAVACAVLLAGPARAQATPTLTFSDEFNGSSLDLTKWSYHQIGPRNDGFFLPGGSVAGGVLTLKTFTELGVHFTTQIASQKLLLLGFEQAYGFFEARLKFNDSPGMWSSFWLQSPTFGNPIGDPATAGVEMDIAEHRVRCVTAPAPTPPATCSPSSDISDRIQQALIWDGYGADSKSAVRLSDPLPGLGNGSWHTWGLAWAPTGLTFYYDGAPIWTEAGPVSQRAEYIVLGSEVGQFFAGAIPPGGYGTSGTTTTNMQVDYVRVWSPG